MQQSTCAAAVGWLANQDAAYHHVPATWGHMESMQADV